MGPRQSKYENNPTPDNQVPIVRSPLDLATEVLIQIFAYLPATDMIAMQRTCRTIRDIISRHHFRHCLPAVHSACQDKIVSTNGLRVTRG